MIGFTIAVPLQTNPLSLNSRQHWRKKAALTKTWRFYAYAHAYGKPAMGECDVTLTWFVTDNRRRDIDNLFGLLKVMADGIVDAQIVPDDTPQYMSKTCDIQRAPEGAPHAYMELKVEPRNARTKKVG